MRKNSVMREYLGYLLPTIVGSIAHTVYCLADVFFVSLGVGPLGLAGINVALPIFTFFSAFSLLIGVGAATTISVCRGANELHRCDQSLTLAMAMVIVVGLGLTLLQLFALEPVCRLLGADDELLPYVADYLRPISWVTVVYLLSSMLSVIVRSDGAPHLVMIAGIVGNLANVVLDYVTVMIWGWGMFGAGLATAIGPCLTVALLSLHFLRSQRHVFFTRHFFSLSLLLRILRNGVGTSALELSSGVVILLFNVTLLQLGGAGAVAIFSIISNLGYVFKGIFNGMAQAAQPIVSVAYGSRDFTTVRKANRCAMGIALGFSLVAYGLILLWPQLMIAPFVSGDTTMLSSGLPAIRLYFISLVFTAINTVLMYYFQSMERAVITMSIALLRGFVLIVLGLALLAYLWGVTGVWLTLAFAEGITALIFLPMLPSFERKLQRSLSESE